MPRALVLAVLLLVGAPGYSAVIIELEHTGDSPFRTYSSATIFIDGKALRIDLDLLPDATAPFDRVVRSDSNGELIAINTRNETWYVLDNDSPLSLSSHMVSMRIGARLEKIRATLTPQDRSAAGTDGQQYVGRTSFDTIEDFQGNVVRASRSITAFITIDRNAEIPRWPFEMLFSTGIAEVDERIREAMAKLPGFPTRIEASFVRIYHGGHPTIEQAGLKVTDISERELPPDQFEVPSGYRYQEPVIGSPGSD